MYLDLLSDKYISGIIIFLPRYPKIMTDEGIRVVRQWLGSSNHLEEGKGAHVFARPCDCVGHTNLFVN